MPTYRRLPLSEIEQMLGIKLSADNERFRAIREHVKRYYPAGAVKALAQMDSEYDDNRYSTAVQYLGVYDQQGNEILPLAKTARECRGQWRDLSIPGLTNEDHDEPAEDVVIPLTGTWLPEMYVKESV